MPTFPNAEYLYTQAELDFLARPDGDADDRAILADSVQPILDAGLARIVEPDEALGDGLRLAPAGGHTPGHTVLWVDGGDGQRAVLAGDTIHHQLQCARPEVAFVSDADPARALRTRRDLLVEVARRRRHPPPRPLPHLPRRAGRTRPRRRGFVAVRADSALTRPQVV